MTENEEKCLKLLAFHYHDDGQCFNFWYIGEKTGLERKQVRRACRALARKGLTKYECGLFNENGEVAGSGYRCTVTGNEEVNREGLPDDQAH